MARLKKHQQQQNTDLDMALKPRRKQYNLVFDAKCYYEQRA